jgi:hypothetical protein
VIALELTTQEQLGRQAVLPTDCGSLRLIKLIGLTNGVVLVRHVEL